jgi:arsenate reductase
MMVVYGIKNCDTVKKARHWLTAQGLEHRFHDVRADGLAPAKLAAWAAAVGWERLLNRSGTTFRRLPPERTAELDEAAALALMLEQPALIRRPVLETGEQVLVGFKLPEYEALSGAGA